MPTIAAAASPDRGMDQVPTQLGDLPHNEFEFAPGRMPFVVRRRVARAEIELVFVHAPGMAEDGCSTVSGSRKPPRVRNGSI
jgi:hypothetical protein